MEITYGEVSTPAFPNRLRALLSVLLLARGTALSQEYIASMIWEVAPKSYLQNIRQHVSRLRIALGDHDPDLGARLETSDSTSQKVAYSFRAERDEVDFALFHRETEAGRTASTETEAAFHFERALDLWRGPAGQDVTGSSLLSSEFEALNETRLTVREDLIELRLRLLPAHHVLHEAREVARIHPLRERAHALLMRSLYLSGDQVGALRVHSELCTRLDDELGVYPGPELAALHLAILQHDLPAIQRLCRLYAASFLEFPSSGIHGRGTSWPA
ncbi:hypothetical protein GCM10027589_03900 [Actinocorallia lasiicapitis]